MNKKTPAKEKKKPRFQKIRENALEGGIYVFRLSVRVQIKRSNNRKKAQSHDNSYYREDIQSWLVAMAIDIIWPSDSPKYIFPIF